MAGSQRSRAVPPVCMQTASLRGAPADLPWPGPLILKPAAGGQAQPIPQGVRPDQMAQPRGGASRRGMVCWLPGDPNGCTPAVEEEGRYGLLLTSELSEPPKA